MLIALLALLGVNLIVIVVLLASVLSRKRWVMKQPGAFRGAIRVAGGEIDGLRPKWGRGYGHWVRDILVWTKGPFLFRNELVPTDSLDELRPARNDEVKRLGDHPGVIRVTPTVRPSKSRPRPRTPSSWSVRIASLPPPRRRARPSRWLLPSAGARAIAYRG
jgi:hypothetical protein